eukprot:251085-Pyramimonas_sp.AAC.1
MRAQILRLNVSRPWASHEPFGRQVVEGGPLSSSTTPLPFGEGKRFLGEVSRGVGGSLFGQWEGQ